MAYIQEQQRLAREEQRKREFEIQKRRLQHISVINPAAANPLDDLFGKKLPSASVSPSPGAMPSGSSTPSSNSSTPPLPPSLPPAVPLSSEPPQGVSVPTPHVASQMQMGSAETDLQKQKRESQHPIPDTGMVTSFRFIFSLLCSMLIIVCCRIATCACGTRGNTATDTTDSVIHTHI